MLALCVEAAFVSFHCVRESHVRYGDAVVIVGLGALGLIAVRIAQQAGAGQVIAIDVGHDQLHPRLAADPRVVDHQGVNLRDLDPALVGAGAEMDQASGRPDPGMPLPAGWDSTPRNAPCPCGSGKKFKHCHGALA